MELLQLGVMEILWLIGKGLQKYAQTKYKILPLIG